MKSKKKKLILFDAHAIIHRAYHALPDFSSSKGEPTGALYGLSAMLIKIISDLKPDYMAACYDLPKPTYRHEAYQDYKAGRKESDEELKVQLERSKDVFESFHVPIYSSEGFEADDILGSVVDQLKDNKDVEIIVASGDMDTLQLVSGKKVQVFTLKKGIQDTVMYDEKAVKARFGFGPELLPDYKGLRGDPSDNISGIQGIGEKTATDLICNFGSIEKIYSILDKSEEKFTKVGIKPRIVNLLKENREDAEFSKMLATIRRDAPIKFNLPKQEWSSSFDTEKIKTLFAELGFRKLLSRVQEFFGEEEEVTQGSFNNMFNQNLSEQELEEAKLALWVVDSTKTNPSLDDILHKANTKDFKKAQKFLMESIKKNNLEFTFEKIEKPLIPVVKAMTKHGTLIDKDYLSNLSKQYHKTLSEIESKIWKEAGEEFNINSPKQMGEVLFEKMQLKPKRLKKTATGQYSTRESELEKMKDLHPIIDLILEYRELQKLLSTYIDNIPEMVDENSRLHAVFLQTGTTTGRMSSNHPNLQNIPIKTELGRKIRNAFVAPKGFDFVALDYSQMELRIAAFLSGDKKLIDIFKNNRDVHTEVASAVFDVESGKVTKEMRRKAKVINFGMLYGMGINALKQNLEVDRKEAQEFYNKYFNVYKTLADYLESLKAQASRQGFTETLFGRRRYFDGINSSLPFIRTANERMAINAPIQGTLADVVKIAMIQVNDYINKNNLENQVKMILQIHDELIFEIDKKIVKEVAPKIKKIMEDVVDLKKTKNVPILVDVESGPNWGELKSIS